MAFRIQSTKSETQNGLTTENLYSQLRSSGLMVDYRDRYDLIRMSVLSLVTEVEDCDFAISAIKKALSAK